MVGKVSSLMPDIQSNSTAARPLPDQITDYWPTQHWQNHTVLVAVSGGADSVALLRCLSQIAVAAQGRGELAVAHVNHRTRGDQSDFDQHWVGQLSDQLGLQYVTRRLQSPPPTSRQGRGFEGWLRQQRYAALLELAQSTGARFVALGHTRDDQVETILFRILRGTGIAGLTGIPPTRQLGPHVTAVRPMLSAGRREIIQYLQAINQDYLHDEQNELLSIARNRLRHGLLPQLREQYNPNVDEAILQLGKLAAEAQVVLDDFAQSLLDQFVHFEPDGVVRIQTQRIESAPDYLLRTALISIWHKMKWPQREMAYHKWVELAEFVADTSKPGEKPSSISLPGNIRVTRDGDLVLIRVTVQED